MSAKEASPDSTTSLTGRVVLGRYRVVRPLARGGMGVVYLGRVEGAAGFSKPVVIKSVLEAMGPEDEGERLFAREARIVSNLQHPGIVAVIDFGKVGSLYVMVLEYVHGYHLGQWLRYVHEVRGQMPVEHAVHAVLSVLDALAFAHGATRADGTSLGIVHRDISPANVLIDVQGHIKLGDFGIARMADDEFKTQEGLFRGTLPYSAPEALRAEAKSPKVDQYACAVILYHLLAGKNPLKGNEPHETMVRVLTHVPPPISMLRRDVPSAIDAALTRAIAKEPADRFDSVGDFAQAIRAGLTWSEREAAQSFAAAIERDFAGTEMAQRLGLEALAVRDASWREAQGSIEDRVSLSSSPPGIESGVRPHSRPLEQLVADASVRRVAEPGGQPAPPPRKTGLFIALAALSAGAGAAAVIALLSRPEPQPASRLLVIEKQAADPAAPAAAPEVHAPAAPKPDDSGSAPSEPPAPSSEPARPAARAGPSPPAEKSQGALLARAFQKQEGKIQSCFERHGAGGQGEPKITVRFHVDTTGAVENAIVSPSSVAGSPLGQCLTGIARATRFDPQPEALSFSIPIAARVVRR